MPQAQKSANARIETITSRDNRWLKRFRAALREDQIEDDVVGLEGPHLVEEALRAGLHPQAFLYSPSGERHFERIRGALPREALRLATSDKLFESVAATRAPQGIAALAKIRRASFDDLLTSAGHAPLVLCLVGVQDPGNVGTALRAAEGFGANGAIVGGGSANPWGQKCLRASAGTALRMPVVSGLQPAVAMAQLRVSGFALAAASVQAGVLPLQVDFARPMALLVGNEGAGLPVEVVRSADLRIRIPLANGVDSLNAAVAASVILYEAARQRGFR